MADETPGKWRVFRPIERYAIRIAFAWLGLFALSQVVPGPWAGPIPAARVITVMAFIMLLVVTAAFLNFKLAIADGQLVFARGWKRTVVALDDIRGIRPVIMPFTLSRGIEISVEGANRPLRIATGRLSRKNQRRFMLLLARTGEPPGVLSTGDRE